MGTRHLTIVRHEGKDVISQYGQWDGYITGQGHKVLLFIHSLIADPDKRAKFIENLSLIYTPTEDERRLQYVACGDDPKNDSGFISYDISNLHAEKFPTMSRDTGAGILELIATASYTGNKIPMIFEDPANAIRACGCEYFYRLDMDEDILTIYEEIDKAPIYTLQFQEIYDGVHAEDVSAKVAAYCGVLEYRHYIFHSRNGAEEEEYQEMLDEYEAKLEELK